MDTALFSSAIGNLLHVTVNTDMLNTESVRCFEERYCYRPELQPMFQAENLSLLMADMEDLVLYEFRDAIGICVLFFRLEQYAVLIGPFVRREFDATRLQRVMVSMGMPASFAESLRLYYSSFPICGMSRAIETVLACIRTFSPESSEFSLTRIDDFPETHKLPKRTYSESLDYSSVYRRYDLENQFLRCIERGDVENVLIAHDQMSSAGPAGNRYTNAIYQDVSIAMAMLRTLARKAAENGGASVVDVHEITQRAVQLTLSARDTKEKVQITRNMIVELTEAVDRARSRVGSYSPAIRKAVDTLRHNYSQELTLPWLAEHVGLSPAHLSRSFSKEVGMSVSQYIASLRCEEAAGMLRNSDAPIHEISAFVGYTDNNYFVKVFRKHYGMTPSEYRTEKPGSKQ